MQTLRFVAAVLASALLALGLSVGAAMAEGERPSESHYTPVGVCLLDDAPSRR
jgi:hypothetical protein